MKCTSCGRQVEAEQNWVEFECPACDKVHVIRCQKCKEMQNVYQCEKCEFVGP